MTGPRAGLGGMTGAALLVTSTVCVALLMSLATVCYMSADGQDVPDELVTITTGLILSATGLLAKTWAERPNSAPDDPQPVEVVQPDGDPIPVAETPRARRRIKPVRAVTLGSSPSPAPDPDHLEQQETR